MKRRTDIADDPVRDLVSPETVGALPESDAVSRFVGDVDRLFPEESTASLEAHHIQMMIQASCPSVAGTPTHPATDGRGPIRESPIWRRWPAYAAAAMAFAALSGVAYAASEGLLPPALQSAVSASAASVGIDVPAHAPLTDTAPPAEASPDESREPEAVTEPEEEASREASAAAEETSEHEAADDGASDEEPIAETPEPESPPASDSD
ncbi:MAG: hypothetical protein EG823_01090 [Actinobacteria bacterium]|nr:hypothetical protein [Actinomycetota bacterium]